MWLLLLEAFLALALLVFIVVWTMRGRRSPPTRSARPPGDDAGGTDGETTPKGPAPPPP